MQRLCQEKGLRPGKALENASGYALDRCVKHVTEATCDSIQGAGKETGNTL